MVSLFFTSRQPTPQLNMILRLIADVMFPQQILAYKKENQNILNS